MRAKKNKIKEMVWALTKAKKITASAHKVLMVLAGHLTDDGAFPSHDRLAALAGCSRSTVIRALEAAYNLGVVARTLRMARRGAYKVRTSNQYQFILDPTQRLIVKAREVLDKARRAAEHRRSQYLSLMAQKRNLSVIRAPDTQENIYSLLDEGRQEHRDRDFYLRFIADCAG